jgi:hypothetical protein
LESVHGGRPGPPLEVYPGAFAFQGFGEDGMGLL